jgi:hypothetical protein
MADKKQKLVIGIGSFVWPKLDEPDSYQPKDRKGNPKGDVVVRYVTDFRVSDKELARVKAKLAEIAKAEGLEGEYKTPIHANKDGVELINAKRSVKIGPPPVFDSKNKQLAKGLKIGGGSEGRIEVTVNVYDGGINFYLDSVQLTKFQEKGVYKSPFETQDDGYDSSEETEETAATGAFPSTSTAEDLDDEIPF